MQKPGDIYVVYYNNLLYKDEMVSVCLSCLSRSLLSHLGMLTSEICFCDC